MKNLTLAFLIVLLSLSNAFGQLFCSYKTQKTVVPDLYIFYKYQHKFSKSDQQKIYAILKDLKKLDKRYRCYLKYYNRYLEKKKLVGMGLYAYKKRMIKDSLKALKYSQKFLDPTMIYYLDLDSILTQKIIALKKQNKTVNTLLSNYLNDTIKNFIFAISQAKANAAYNKGLNRVNSLIEAIEINQTELEYKNKYIGLLVGDAQTTKLITKEYQNYQKTHPQQPQTGGQPANQSNIKQTQNKQKPKNNKQNQQQQNKQTQTKPNYTHKPKQKPQQQPQQQFAFPMPKDIVHINPDIYKPYFLNIEPNDTNYHNYKVYISRATAIERQIYSGKQKATLSLAKALGEYYYKAYSYLFNFYNIQLDSKEQKQSQIYLLTAQYLYKQYADTNISKLWQANLALAAGLVKQQKIFDSVYLIKSNVNINIPIPKIPQIQKQLTAQAQKQKTNKQHKKTASKPKPKCITKYFTYTQINKVYPLKETGTYYRIYITKSPYKLIPKEYNGLPITYKACTNLKKQYYTFYVGKFSSYQEAQKTLNELRKNLPNSVKPRIVKFVNGRPAGEPAPSQPTYTHTYQLQNIHNTKYLIYTIRIITLSTLKPASQIKHLKKLYFDQAPDGKYVYYDGPYYSYNAAKAALTKLKNLGYNDAKIYAFNNGQKISLDKAQQIERSVKAKNQLTYGIQIGAFSKKLSQDQLRKTFKNIYGKYTIRYTYYNNLYIYYIPAGTSYSQAQNLKNKLRSLGYSGAFIRKLKNNQIID